MYKYKYLVQTQGSQTYSRTVSASSINPDPGNKASYPGIQLQTIGFLQIQETLIQTLGTVFQTLEVPLPLSRTFIRSFKKEKVSKTLQECRIVCVTLDRRCHSCHGLICLRDLWIKGVD